MHCRIGAELNSAYGGSQPINNDCWQQDRFSEQSNHRRADAALGDQQTHSTDTKLPSQLGKLLIQFRALAARCSLQATPEQPPADCDDRQRTTDTDASHDVARTDGQSNVERGQVSSNSAASAALNGTAANEESSAGSH